MKPESRKLKFLNENPGESSVKEENLQNIFIKVKKLEIKEDENLNLVFSSVTWFGIVRRAKSVENNAM